MRPTNLTHDQNTAIDECLDGAKRIVGITGEAGTGKTLVLGQVCTELKDMAYKVALCAPTGRAASRIAEASGHHAMTIHRMLRMSMPADDEEAGFPAYTRFNPMPYDFILVDESSMISNDLYRSIIDAMKPGACIRFFGDANQLPPVEGESPFLSVLTRFTSVVLEENFRSTDGVVSAARKINRGILPQANEQFQILNLGGGMTYSAIEKFLDDTFATTESQIIIPIKGGNFGTYRINNFVQQKLNNHKRRFQVRIPKDHESETKPVWIRPGDKIIWTKNDYKLRLFNGQIGYVVDFDEEEGTVIINIEGRDYEIPPILESYDQAGNAIFRYDPRRYIDLAYAITTHKSQGSEFQKIIMLLNRSRVLTRQNFYTGVTRARKHVTVIAGPGGLSAAMSTDVKAVTKK